MDWGSRAQHTYTPAVIDQFIGWALMVGLVVGGALVWFAIGRLPRSSEDITPEERIAEAAWISGIIDGRGGVAPEDLVEEVLELHAEYLEHQVQEPAQ
jgi:hypothetical protein